MCKHFYWHLIENDQHNPKCKKAWIKEFPNLEPVDDSVWKRVVNLPFSTTEIQKSNNFNLE